MKFYTFYAKANPAFLKSLKNELNHIGVKRIFDLSKDRLNYLKFTAELPVAWKIMLYSRLIEHLKIQIGEGFQVRYCFIIKIEMKKN
jgi:hypothetical protein